jgi:hypothetical protein
MVGLRGRFSGGLGLPWLARWAENRAWRNADYVLPVTRVLAGHVAAAGVPDERIVVIPNGINRDHFAATPAPDIAKQRLGLAGKLVLGFTGFVRDWHGVDRVIRWMATPDAPANAALMVVGDGPIRGELERLAETLALHGRVRFTGVIDRDRVPDTSPPSTSPCNLLSSPTPHRSNSSNTSPSAKPSSPRASPTSKKSSPTATMPCCSTPPYPTRSSKL